VGKRVVHVGSWKKDYGKRRKKEKLKMRNMKSKVALKNEVLDRNKSL
jgi:hypothetical protein